MPYLLETGHDVALESLVAIAPQPATVGLRYTRRQVAASGDVIDEGPYAEFEFSTLSVAAYQSLLSQFGLSTATTSNVSVYIQDERYNWIIRNGVAVLPFVGTDGQRDRYFLRNFTILVKNIRVQS